MKDFEINKTNGDLEVTQLWKWKEIKPAQIRTFQWVNEPEVVHIIKTCFDDLFLIVWEDSYQRSIGNTELLRKQQIKDKFNIEL